MNVDQDAVGRSLRTAVRGRLRDAVARIPGPGDQPPDAPDPSTGAAWSALVRMGTPAFEAPLDSDGLGLGLTAGTAVAEELGRAALAGGYLSAALAIDAATADDTPDNRPGSAPSHRHGLVRDLVGGDLPVALAGFERPGSVRAAVDGTGGLRLTGRLPMDPTTDAVLLPAAWDSGDTRLVLLAPSTVEVRSWREPSGALGLADLADTPCPAATVLCRWTPGEDCPEGVPGRARIRQAAYLLGLARGALLTGVRYATDRRQFGRPLRDFQSVAFRLAAAYVDVEALRLAVDRAVRLADSGQPYGRQAAEVLAQAAETAADVSSLVMQVCGARGLTGELPAHRYYLLVRRESGRLGRPGDLWREAGRDRLRRAAGDRSTDQGTVGVLDRSSDPDRENPHPPVEYASGSSGQACPVSDRSTGRPQQTVDVR